MVTNQDINNVFTFYLDQLSIGEKFAITPQSAKYIFLPLSATYIFKGNFIKVVFLILNIFCNDFNYIPIKLK